MKQKVIYISDEAHAYLQEQHNASRFIEELLRESMQIKIAKKLSPAEIEKQIKILEIQIAAKKQIEEIENGNSK